MSSCEGGTTGAVSAEGNRLSPEADRGYGGCAIQNRIRRTPVMRVQSAIDISGVGSQEGVVVDKQRTASESTVCVEVEVLRTVYRKAETGFTVLSVREVGRGASESVGLRVFKVVGEFRTPPVDCQRLLLVGRWEYGPWGEQFRVIAVSGVRPHTPDGIKAYLASGVISGIGPVLAQRIVERLGRDALTVLDLQPERLIEIQGIGESTIQQIVKSWQRQKAQAAALTELLGLGLSVRVANKVLRRSGWRQRGGFGKIRTAWLSSGGSGFCGPTASPGDWEWR